MAFTEKLKKEIEAATAPSLTDIQEGAEDQATNAALAFERALKVTPRSELGAKSHVMPAPAADPVADTGWDSEPKPYSGQGPIDQAAAAATGPPVPGPEPLAYTQGGPLQRIPLSQEDIKGATFTAPASSAEPPAAASSPAAAAPPAAPPAVPPADAAEIPGPPDMAGSVPVKPPAPPKAPSFGEKLGALAKKLGVPLLHLIQAGAYGYTGNQKETVLEGLKKQKAKMQETEAGRAYEQAMKQQDRDFAVKLAAIQAEYQRTGDERTAQQAMERLKIEQQGALQRTQIMAQSGPGGSSNSFQADADKLLK